MFLPSVGANGLCMFSSATSPSVSPFRNDMTYGVLEQWRECIESVWSSDDTKNKTTTFLRGYLAPRLENGVEL